MLKKPFKPQNLHRINNQIKISPIVVIDKDGQNLGVMTADKGRFYARQDGLDLVEVSPTARPPVCRIMDYGKFKYELSIKEKNSKKSNHRQLKEIRIRPFIGENDLETKIRSVSKFLEDGNNVLVMVQYKRRENAHKELGLVAMNKILEAVKEIGSTKSNPGFNGNNLVCLLEPKKGTEK